MDNDFEMMDNIDFESQSVFVENDFYNEQEEDVATTGIESISQMAISGTDWTTETIVRQIEKGNIILDPDFQRRDAWTTKKKSRFIESLFLGFPIPQIVLAESQKKGKFIVIDGKQRLLSLQQFMRNDNSELKALKLNGLDVKKELNGKTYRKMIDEGLDSDIDALCNQPIRTIVVKNWPSVEVLYHIFLRLNTGSVKLSPQELRQALYPGEFTSFANKKAIESKGIKRMLKIKGTTGDFRMRDVELLIRFMAFHFYVKQYHGSMQAFLDKACGTLNKTWSKNKADIEKSMFSFEAAVESTYVIFGDNAFCKYKNQYYESKINRAIMDIMLYYFSDAEIREAAVANQESVELSFRSLCTKDTQFLDSIEQTTKSIPAVTYRFNAWAEALSDAIHIPVSSPLQV